MDELLQWGWRGALLIVVPYIIFFTLPVAFGAWKSGNPIAGVLKTVGPLLSLAVLLYGGWTVIKSAATWIYQDAQQNPLVMDAQRWTGDGAGALESGVGAAKDYAATWRDGLSSGADAGMSAMTGSGSGASDGTWGNQAASPTRQPQASGAAARPAATPVVGVHAAQPDYAGAIHPDEINAQAERNAALGERARAEATRTGNSSSLNGNSENLMFGTGGGGPTEAQADAALVQAEEQRTYRVGRGEGLIDIAERFYGPGNRWDNAMRICKANALRDCNRLSVNQLLVIP